ncbi:hypothetical protein GCM10011610_69260 [Nocardia rhizosphaerihabitans]|uniref:Uncharacterized protein n=1 Tax=Nocardia rhizosphaerihabitans TaxID=1691570 RepID=A0ABQ2L2T1_9NOCA|nr:hypothetical protein GCM10011610_69260 [Nocardia rhizosphaerihabitans]
MIPSPSAVTPAEGPVGGRDSDSLWIGELRVGAQPEDAGGLRVGGQERLEVEFGDGDIGRGGEGGAGGDQTQVAVVGAQVQGDGEADVVGAGAVAGR